MPITITLVPQAITFHNPEFLCAPIRSLRLMSSNMRMITTGNSTPFSTWLSTADFTSIESGRKSTVIAPPAMSSVYSQ